MPTVAIETTITIAQMADGGTLKLGPRTVQITNPILTRVDSFDLASGPNTIPVAVGQTVFIFTPPAGNAIAITMKGVTGDTGTPLNKTRQQIFHLDGSGADLVLTAAGAITGCAYQLA